MKEALLRKLRRRAHGSETSQRPRWSGNWQQYEPHHYCFHVSDEEFEAIFDRIHTAGISYRSQPQGPEDMTINTRYGGKDVYWQEPDGHIWEMLTVSYARSASSTVNAASS